jgi:uncharacterized protein (TIGR00251 family)
MQPVTHDEWLRETPDGVSLAVKVIPRAGVTKIAGARDRRLLIRLAAAPVDGAANDALLAFLSGVLNVPARRIKVVSGAHSRNKLVAISGMTIAQAASVILLLAERA